MATSNYYDLIVLGSDLAGLVVAALVARRGKRVLILPTAPLDGVDTAAPEPVVCDPTPNPLRRLAALPPDLDELGVWQQIRRERQAIAGRLHLALPGHRLDLNPGLANLASELDRELPGSADAWTAHQRAAAAAEAAWDEILGGDIPATGDGLWERRAVAKIAPLLAGGGDDLPALPAAHPLRAASRAMLPWLTHLPPSQVGEAATLRLAAQWERGPEDLVGGVPRLRAVLLERLLTHAGEVKTGLRVAELIVQRGRITGLAFFGKRDHYGCEHLLLADDPAHILGDLGPVDALQAALGIPLGDARPVARRFVLTLEVDIAGLSPALDGVVVHLRETAGWLDRHGIGTSYVRVDPTVVSDAQRVVITHVVAADQRTADLRERVLDGLDRAGILPFIYDHLRWSYSPHDGRGALDGRLRPLGDGPLNPRPAAMDPLLASAAAPPPLGVALIPHTTELRNLSLACRAVLPGLGLEGELATALTVAGAIAAPGRARGRPLYLGR